MKKLILIIIIVIVIAAVAYILLHNVGNSKGDHEIVISEILEVKGRKIFDEEEEFTLKYKAGKLPHNIEEDEKNIFVCYITNDGKYIRMGNSKIDSDENEVSFTTRIPGEYVVLGRNEPYGIFRNGKIKGSTEPLLLIHGPLTGKETWSKLIEEVKEKYPYKAILNFEYAPNASLRKSSRLLAAELEELHKDFGDFRADVVTHSFGSQILVGYIASNDFPNDVKSILHLSPTLEGDASADEEIREEELERSENTNRTAELLAAWLATGEADFLISGDEYYEELYDKYKKNTLSAQQGGKAEYHIEIEDLWGWTEYSIYQPPDGRVSVLSRESFNTENQSICNNDEVIAKVLDFLELPAPFSTAFLKEKHLDDLYKQTEYEITVHKWRDSDTFYIYQLNKNMLATVEENGILFTNGDMDTFYAWDLQNRENYRCDVAVVNLSLLNTAWFIKLVRDEMGVEFNIPDDEIDVCDETRNSVLYPRVVQRGEKIIIPVNSSSEGFTVELAASEVFYTNDLAVIQIIKDNYGKRPIYFSITCADHSGFKNHLQNEGMAEKVVNEVNSKINIEKLVNNLDNVYDFSGIKENYDKIDVNTRRLFNNYGAAFMRASCYYQTQQNISKSIEYMERALDFIAQKDRFYPSLIDLYEKLALDIQENSGREKEELITKLEAMLENKDMKVHIERMWEILNNLK